ncbi:hypothetical protein [Deinococcus pimensis]|uniref:hypothetical protein n=1 Tax=Deinococcus pimensis TaxID=309888 RepID=UPI0005EB4B42|nr:hypothetical protein [Deinococcus pimensis]
MTGLSGLDYTDRSYEEVGEAAVIHVRLRPGAAAPEVGTITQVDGNQVRVARTYADLEDGSTTVVVVHRV